MLKARIARGEATGILCSPEEAERWRRHLEQEIPLLQRVGEGTLYFHTGAVVVFRATPEEARSWESRRKGAVVWIDEANALEAPLPAPKEPSDP
jgi:hypothetical protein